MRLVRNTRKKGEHYYITFKGEVNELFVNSEGLWEDQHGGIWALNDQMFTVGDEVLRCGIGILSLPPNHPLTDLACKYHDYLDTSPEYIAFHSYEEAAIYLRKLVKQTKYSFWGQTFYRLIQLRNWVTGRD